MSVINLSFQYIKCSRLSRCIHQSAVSYKKNNIFDLLSEMPKTQKTQKTDLRQKRLKAKTSTVFATPCTIKLSVLGNGSQGCPRCVFLSTTNESYLFNCGEGTQRLSSEHKLRLSKLEHIFITRRSWKNLGGLPGMSLTVQDIGVPSVTLHGPPKLIELYDMMKVFIDLKDLEIVQKVYTEKSFIGKCMEVSYVPLFGRPSEKTALSVDVPEFSKDSDIQEAARKKVKLSENDDDEKDMTVAYICKCHNKPGQLLLEKCIQQGVIPGPLLGQLKNGKDVTLQNGNVVRSKDVVAPEEPGPIFIILECPSTDYLDGLLQDKAFMTHQLNNTNDTDQAAVVIHFTEENVLCDPRYQEWMNRFSSSTFHLILNSSNSSLSSIAVNKIQYWLHLIHPRIFPLLKHNISTISNHNYGSLVVHAENMMSFHLRPKDGLERECSVKLDTELFIQDAFDQPNFRNNLQELQKKLHEENGLIPTISVEENPEVIFLGTGSCIPSKARNVSGILINISSSTSILFDCGEGTYIQLYRFLGSEQLQNILRNLSCIFISHLHADHHLGLVQLLEARKEIISEDDSVLYILAPYRIIKWLNNYHSEFEPILHNIRLIPNIDMAYNNCIMDQKEYKELLMKSELKSISTVHVEHCKDAHGIVVTMNNGYKIVYSGDTLPCDNLVSAGLNCSLLIHEATMEDDLEEEARLKNHSTTSQAIDVSKRMGAEFTILTHFSQRYGKIPLFPDNCDKVGFAFDNMVVRPCDLHLLPLFLPSLKALFAKYYEFMKEKTSKYLRKKQLIEEFYEQNIKQPSSL